MIIEILMTSAAAAGIKVTPTLVRPAMTISGTFTDDDYPEGAKPLGYGGTTEVQLNIGSDGLLYNCSIAKSAGIALLDERTCEIFQERFKFAPALDATGAPVASVYVRRIRWVVQSPPIREHFLTYEVEIDENGSVTNCVVTKSINRDTDPCYDIANRMTFEPHLNAAGKPIKAKRRITDSAETIN